MTKISDEAKQVLDDNLAIQSTVGPDGVPDIGPKGSLRSYDDEHIIYNERTGRKTLENIQAGSQIAVLALDLKRFIGFRFFGTPELKGPGTPEYRNAHEWGLQDGHGDPKYAVLIHVERVDKT